ncbi:MAG: ribosome maturation factor [Chitinophagaceae bacterium]|jgi:ribosome maturation factor RimP|nr:ribosome maturation factor [Chitinophagaceae bacterium]
MSVENKLQQIETLLNGFLAEQPEFFLVSLRIKPTDNVKVFLDGDNGITIEKCIYFNRKLRNAIEENGIYPEGEYSLEISSPGVGEPLKQHRQYSKNINRFVEVILNDDTKKEGQLLTVTEADILIETIEGKGKKAVTQQLVIPFTNIKSTTVQIKF